jgi:hypothetical protein
MFEGWRGRNSSIQLFSIYVIGLCLLNLNIGLIIFLFCWQDEPDLTTIDWKMLVVAAYKCQVYKTWKISNMLLLVLCVDLL